MRVSTGMIFDLGVSAMNKQTASLLHLSQQVATGRRILTPADDPVAAARALEVQQAQDITTQYTTNQSNAKSALGLSDATLSSVGDLLTRVKELTIQGGNGTLTTSDRQSIAHELSANFDQLMGLANSTDGTGQYLYSGYQGSTIPFSGSVATGVSYVGDSGQRLLQVSASRQLGVSDSGSDIFQRIPNGNGFFSTGLDATVANTGTGVIDGGSISDPAKWNSVSNSGNLQVKFWTAPTGAEALGSVDIPATGLSIQTGVNDKFNISIDGSSFATVTVTSGALGTGTPANLAAAVQASINSNPVIAGLGKSVTVSVVSVNGASRLAVTSNATPLTTSNVTLTAATGNTGMSALFGTPTTGTTYYDLVDMSTAPPASLFLPPPAGNSTTTFPGNTYTHAYSPGVPITFSGLAAPYNDFGASVTITGTPASGDVFTVTKSTSQDIFTTLKNLITALSNPQAATAAGNAAFTNQIGFALTNLDQAANNVLRVRSLVGSRLSEVDALGNTNSALSLQYQQTLSNLQDLDYAKTYSDLTRNQTSLTAAQKSFQMTNQLSLFNYLP